MTCGDNALRTLRFIEPLSALIRVYDGDNDDPRARHHLCSLLRSAAGGDCGHSHLGAAGGCCARALIGRVPQPRRAALARVRDPATDEVIDEGLALWFPGPHSETGEDIAELQIHGGRAVIAATLAALAKLEGFRHAEAGEFTRRAFENGRMDLTAVEGLADLVAAETEAQRRQAFRQMRGHLAEQADQWRERLIEARALVEAGIDFSDEGDVPKNLARQALDIIRPVADEIGQAGRGRGERLRDGLQVAIAGPPNVGKSTLINRIARRDVAIVSPLRRDDAGRHRGASRSGGLSGHAARYRRHPRDRRPGRTRGCSPGAAVGHRGGPGAVGARRAGDRTRGGDEGVRAGGGAAAAGLVPGQQDRSGGNGCPGEN